MENYCVILKDDIKYKLLLEYEFLKKDTIYYINKISGDWVTLTFGVTVHKSFVQLITLEDLNYDDMCVGDTIIFPTSNGKIETIQDIKKSDTLEVTTDLGVVKFLHLYKKIRVD